MAVFGVGSNGILKDIQIKVVNQEQEGCHSIRFHQQRLPARVFPATLPTTSQRMVHGLGLRPFS